MRSLASYFSCIAGGGAWGGRPTTVVDWEGNTLRREIPMTVAELMLEVPAHLVASADEVGRTRRAIPMRADEPLRPGGVYLLFPAGRARCRVPDEKVASLAGVRGAGKRREAAGKGRRSSGGSRVFPGVVACPGKEEAEEQLPDGAEPVFTKLVEEDGGGGGRVGIGRRWKPALETINESR